MSTIIELSQVPNTATEGDKWIDTFNQRDFYVARQTYGLTTSTLIIPASDRPGAVDLTFSAVNAGGDGDLIDVAIVNGGASGTAALVITGSGTTTDHFLYTFTIYDNDGSNDAFITLLSGDSDLTASGADATNGTFNETTQVALTGAISFWRAVNVHLEYAAEIPEIIDPTADLNNSIPLDVLRVLADELASRQLITDEGGDKNLAGIYHDRFEKGVNRGIKHRSKAVVPTDVSPG